MAQDQSQPSTNNTNLNEVFLSSRATIGTPWRLFVFSVVFFAFSLLVYFGFKVGYENYLSSQSEELDKNLAQLSNSVSQEDQQHFINIYSQIVNLKNVLEEHYFAGNIFPFLEANTMPQVFYSDAKFTAFSRTLDLTGAAASLKALAEQMSQFEKSPELDSATLSSMNFNPSGNTSFTISLVFKEGYLSKPL